VHFFIIANFVVKKEPL